MKEKHELKTEFTDEQLSVNGNIQDDFEYLKKKAKITLLLSAFDKALIIVFSTILIPISIFAAFLITTPLDPIFLIMIGISGITLLIWYLVHYLSKRIVIKYKEKYIPNYNEVIKKVYGGLYNELMVEGISEGANPLFELKWLMKIVKKIYGTNLFDFSVEYHAYMAFRSGLIKEGEKIILAENTSVKVNKTKGLSSNNKLPGILLTLSSMRGIIFLEPYPHKTLIEEKSKISWDIKLFAWAYLLAEYLLALIFSLITFPIAIPYIIVELNKRKVKQAFYTYNKSSFSRDYSNISLDEAIRDYGATGTILCLNQLDSNNFPIVFNTEPIKYNESKKAIPLKIKITRSKLKSLIKNF